MGTTLNTLKRTPKRPNIHPGPYRKLYKMFLAPPAHPLSDVRPQVLFIYEQIPKYYYDSIFGLADTGDRTCEPKPQNQKKNEKKILLTLPAPGLEPTTLNTLKRTPKGPNIHPGPYRKLYKNVLAPPAHPLSDVRPQVLFIYEQIPFAHYDSIFDLADTGDRTREPKPQNQKKMKKKFF